jgi:hypothetical protein
MGRWAQSRRRGCGGGSTGFPLPPPTGDDWDPTLVGGGEVDAEIRTPSPATDFWGCQFTDGEIPGPALPWQPGAIDSSASNLVVGTFGPERIWVRVAWFSDLTTQVSDWSEPQFADL